MPQGSILGPLLFILYINDLKFSLINSKCLLFADDSTIYCSGSDINNVKTNLESDLSIVIDWFKANKMSLNIDKTNLLHFKKSKHDNDCTVSFGNTLIEPVNKTKFLGIIIDNNLDWKSHIEYVNNKLNSSLYGLRILRNLLPKSLIRTIFYAIFDSHLSYGINLWGGTYKSSLNCLVVIQKKPYELFVNNLIILILILYLNLKRYCP